jgi:histidyl-tRNA synthetase
MANKPTNARGTRDFSPLEMKRRNYIFDTLKSVFIKYGFEQIETPAIENLETLTGKYGDEGDKLIFKILNSGDYLSKADEKALADKDSSALISSISEKALRYDLTVPFARYVVQHQHEINFPFKRFQIQPVWRADRPQKGRYREFYQCDCDIIGSDSLINEFDLVKIFDEGLSNLGLNDFNIKINNRKILSGIAEIANASDKIIDITVAIDKLDKIGKDKVNEEILSKGVSQDSLNKIQFLFDLSGSNVKMIGLLKTHLSTSEIGKKGIEELETVLNLITKNPLKNAKLELDVCLARGLNYYTGAIFEVKANNVSIGSICGGGRYDDLTGIFGLPNISGVGISFGADRIYDVLLELNLFPNFETENKQVLFVNFGNKEIEHILPIANQLREKGIACEVYPDEAKLKKQFKYADSKNIRFVAVIGEEEISDNTIQLKDMVSGEQEKLTAEEIISKLC